MSSLSKESDYLYLLGTNSFPTIKRPPLGSWPPGDYVKVLPWKPPNDRDFLRSNSWSVVMPDAPWVPGVSDKHPERILSWFIDRYNSSFRTDYLKKYASYGYTHLKRSYADSCIGNNQSLSQFVNSCLECKQFVKYIQVVIGSKDYQPWNMSVQQWVDFAFPIMDALIKVNAVDEFIPGWEWNLWNIPGQTTIDIFRSIGRHAHNYGKSCWMHFSSGETAWFADKDPRGRFGFYDDLKNDIDGINYQSDQSWDLAMSQARYVDTLWQFGLRGNDYKFRADEVGAVQQGFNEDHPTEIETNMAGYIACCTVDNVHGTDAKVWGYGCGGQLPDGNVL